MQLIFLLYVLIIIVKMPKVKTFFQVCTSSLLPRQSSYHAFLKKPLAFSLRYFIYLTLFVYYIVLIIIILRTGCFLPLRSTVQGIRNGMQDYPSDLVISVQNGQLASNYNRPYFFWMKNGNSERLLAVVDETGTPEKIRSYGSLVLATARSLTFIDPRADRTVTVPYHKTQMTLTKETVADMSRRLAFIWKVGSMVALALVMGLLPLIVVLTGIGYGAIASVFAFIVSKLFLKPAVSKKISFSKTFQMSLHAATLPIFTTALVFVLGMHSRAYPSLAFLLLVAMTCVGVYDAYTTEASRS